MNIPMMVAISNVSLPVSIGSSAVALDVSPALAYEVGCEPYEGEYEFTPSDDGQTIRCENKMMMQDITIHPIPSNYGKVSWDGAKIMIE